MLDFLANYETNYAKHIGYIQIRDECQFYNLRCREFFISLWKQGFDTFSFTIKCEPLQNVKAPKLSIIFLYNLFLIKTSFLLKEFVQCRLLIEIEIWPGLYIKCTIESLIPVFWLFIVSFAQMCLQVSHTYCPVMPECVHNWVALYYSHIKSTLNICFEWFLRYISLIP